MIDIKLLEALVKLVDESSLDSLEIEGEELRIRMAKTPEGGLVPAAAPLVASAPPPPAPASAQAEPAAATDAAPVETPPAGAADANVVEITSPMVGTFYRAPSPEAEPYVKVGDGVAEGDVLCVIEAMKLMNELECEHAGRIVEICVDNAEAVDYGQLLFRVARG